MLGFQRITKGSGSGDGFFVLAQLPSQNSSPALIMESYPHLPRPPGSFQNEKHSRTKLPNVSLHGTFFKGRRTNCNSRRVFLIEFIGSALKLLLFFGDLVRHFIFFSLGFQNFNNILFSRLKDCTMIENKYNIL